MELKFACSQNNIKRLSIVLKLSNLQYIKSVFSSTDAYLDNLTLEHCCKRELYLYKCVDNKSTSALFSPVKPPIITRKLLNASDKCSVQDLVSDIENYFKGEIGIPDYRLDFLLVYFSKNGNIAGVEALQMLIKKHNLKHFQLHSEYKHYLAEALFINGKVEDSLDKFFSAYNNIQIRDKVKLMLVCLFPRLSTQYSDIILKKTINKIEQFALEHQDQVILGCLWKSLFKSTWFSDQQLAKQLLERNYSLLHVIQWMIPAIGRELLQEHKIDDFYRLIELTLKYELKRFEGSLLHLLFDYYYIHQNIEQCSAVVKYVSSSSHFQLSEDQQTKYINLLIKSKDSVTSKLNIKPPQNLPYKF